MDKLDNIVVEEQVVLEEVEVEKVIPRVQYLMEAEAEDFQETEEVVVLQMVVNLFKMVEQEVLLPGGLEEEEDLIFLFMVAEVVHMEVVEVEVTPVVVLEELIVMELVEVEAHLILEQINLIHRLFNLEMVRLYLLGQAVLPQPHKYQA
jgi:hypothetical protein